MPVPSPHRQDRGMDTARTEYAKVACVLLVAACLHVPWLMQLVKETPTSAQIGVVVYIFFAVLQLLACGLVWYSATATALYCAAFSSMLQLPLSFALGNLSAVSALHAWKCCYPELRELDPFLDHLDGKCDDTNCPMTLVEQSGLVLCAWVMFYCCVHVLLWHKEMRTLIAIQLSHERYTPSAPLSLELQTEQFEAPRRSEEFEVL